MNLQLQKLISKTSLKEYSPDIIIFTLEKISETFHRLLKKDADNFEKHIRKTNPKQKNIEILSSDGIAPRLVYSIKSKNTKEDKIFTFKFSLQEILEKTFSSDTFEFALTRNDGKVIISSKNKILNNNVDELNNQKENKTLKTKNVSNTLVVESFQKIDDEPTKVIIGYNKLDYIDSYLISGIRSNRAFRVTNTIITKVVLIFFIILSICSIISLVLSKAITRPLNNLVTATEVIASGKFEHRINIHSGDELRALSQSFNLMTDKINEYNQKLLDANLFLEDKVKARTKELQSANDFTKAVLSSIDQALFVFNKDGIILDVNNPRCREIWAQDITDLHIREIFPFTDPSVIKMWLKNLFEERLDFKSIIRLGPTKIDFKDREKLANIEISYFPMRNKKGRIENVIGLASDRTEKVEFEKQMEINTAKVNSILQISSQKAEYQGFVAETISSFSSLKNFLMNQTSTFKKSQSRPCATFIP